MTEKKIEKAAKKAIGEAKPKDEPVKDEGPVKDEAPKYVTVEDMEGILDAWSKRNAKRLHIPTEVDSGFIQQSEPIPMGEIGVSKDIEPVAEANFKKAAELEEFMNQRLEIVISSDPSQGSIPFATPIVNGINHPIKRGVPTLVKRFFVEALARGKTTRHEQTTPDASNPQNINMNPITGVVYPFEVRKDPDPRGPAWLDGIRREA